MGQRSRNFKKEYYKEKLKDYLRIYILARKKFLKWATVGDSI